MNRDEISFSVQMTPKELLKFTVYHNYHKLSGLIGVALSLIALFILITAFGELNDRDKTVLTLVAVWFIVFEPVSLIQRAKNQVKRNKTYQKPLDYCVNAEGITVSQGEEHQTLPWENIRKIVETKSQYFVYSSNIHAFIFPKSALGEDSEAVVQLMVQYTKDLGTRYLGQIKKRIGRAE
ncbi:MAG: YcxB family protein [Lachnospiraceae bacterium]|nr:YcxB family protein [Lachnospiraceae bacterium]MDE6624823.1 YcxB family protein [Lachnospiraceae bacterium]